MSQQAPRRRSTNGQPSEEPVASELDVYDRVTRSAADTEFKKTNFGLGFYGSERELWQQIESYRDGVYGRAAFARPIMARAEKEAKEGFLREKHRLHAPDEDYEDWRARNEDRWEDADDEERAAAIEEHAGIDPTWKPPQWRTAEMRLEVSRGRDARLLDNVFGRVVKRISEGAGELKDALADLRGSDR